MKAKVPTPTPGVAPDAALVILRCLAVTKSRVTTMVQNLRDLYRDIAHLEGMVAQDHELAINGEITEEIPPEILERAEEFLKRLTGSGTPTSTPATSPLKINAKPRVDRSSRAFRQKMSKASKKAWAKRKATAR